MVAIKDMEMPKSCFDCSFCELPGSLCVCKAGHFTFERKKEFTKKRHPDCLLVKTQERKVGKWICVHHIENKITYDSWKCSECQHDFNSEEESMVDFDEYKYCPNCGAEMRGAENDC